jgi:superfamily II DNA or RNA helicase
MTPTVELLQSKAGIEWFDYQLAALTRAAGQPGPSQRLCLYYKTGAGKTLTALGLTALWGHSEAVVVSPPSTHEQWEKAGYQIGITVEAMSHAKFRRQETKLSRTKAIIADEFHLFGGHGGMGWKKLDKLAQHLKAPLILASATPNYNDAERVYCIQHILDPGSVKGGYLAFLYANCLTEENFFGRVPKVTGFQRYASAADYLADLPKVEYLKDDLVYKIHDTPLHAVVPVALEKFGYNKRADRIIASQMEERHALINLAMVSDYGRLYDYIYDVVAHQVESQATPTLVFAAHATIAEALGVSLQRNKVKHRVVTGALSAKRKQEAIDRFIKGDLEVLVGTASLATGTDGMDKVCDSLLILDDTDDDALRRQLIGRIMPRGADATSAHTKYVQRLVLS